MKQMYPYIYLASQSPRRQELLKQIGVRFELLLADSDEDAESLELTITDEPALDYVKRVTLAKLQAAHKRLKKRDLQWAPILCSDTTVAVSINGKESILGKPVDHEDAKRILQLLSGKTHQVHTAVALLNQTSVRNLELSGDNGDVESLLLLSVSSSQVTFKMLSESLISSYVTSGEPFGKAGAYGIQGLAACFIENIQGSFSGIMGLPLFETAQLLQASDVQFDLNISR
jgi:septum formation protein